MKRKPLVAAAAALCLCLTLTACSPKETLKPIILKVCTMLGLVSEDADDDTDTRVFAEDGGEVVFPAGMDTSAARFVSYAAPQHLARIGGQPAGDDADQRAFARAVRPQKAIQARAEGERHPSQSLFGFRLALPAAVQQRCGQQISFAQIVQFQLHGRCTLSFVQAL